MFYESESAASAAYCHLGIRGCIATTDVKDALTCAGAAAAGSTQLRAESAHVRHLGYPYSRLCPGCIEQRYVTTTVRWTDVNALTILWPRALL